MRIDRIGFDMVELVPAESIDEAFRIRFRDLAGQDAERLHIILMMEFPWSVERWSNAETSCSGSGLRCVPFGCGRPLVGVGPYGGKHSEDRGARVPRPRGLPTGARPTTVTQHLPLPERLDSAPGSLEMPAIAPYFANRGNPVRNLVL